MISLDSTVEVQKINTYPHRPICFANGESTCCSSREGCDLLLQVAFECVRDIARSILHRCHLSLIMAFPQANILIPRIRPCLPAALPPRLYVARRSSNEHVHSLRAFRVERVLGTTRSSSHTDRGQRPFVGTTVPSYIVSVVFLASWVANQSVTVA